MKNVLPCIAMNCADAQRPHPIVESYTAKTLAGYMMLIEPTSLTKERQWTKER